MPPCSLSGVVQISWSSQRLEIWIKHTKGHLTRHFFSPFFRHLWLCNIGEKLEPLVETLLFFVFFVFLKTGSLQYQIRKNENLSILLRLKTFRSKGCKMVDTSAFMCSLNNLSKWTREWKCSKLKYLTCSVS